MGCICRSQLDEAGNTVRHRYEHTTHLTIGFTFELAGEYDAHGRQMAVDAIFILGEGGKQRKNGVLEATREHLILAGRNRSNVRELDPLLSQGGKQVLV